MIRINTLSDLLDKYEFIGFLKGLAAARKDMDAAWFSGYTEGFRVGRETAPQFITDGANVSDLLNAYCEGIKYGEERAHQEYVDALQNVVDREEKRHG